MVPHPPETTQAHNQAERREGDEDPEDLEGVGCPLAVRQGPLGPRQLLPQPAVLPDQTLILCLDPIFLNIKSKKI